MLVLVACEFSQIVCRAFRERGHEAFSCDILPYEGGHPEWHIQDDVLNYIDLGCWDMMIAHPPRTYLSHAGARWLYPKGILNEDRYEKGIEARGFFMRLLNANIPLIAVENPQPSRIFGLPKESQIIQPYEFGDEAQKKTLLWLKNLPELKPTKMVGKGEFVTYKSGKRKAKWFMDAAKNTTKEERAKLRSYTFQGIANAMAEQWGKQNDH